MSGDHAEKIRNWLVTMMLVALGMIASWNAAGHFGCMLEDLPCFAALGSSLVTAIILLPLAFAWHLLDFLHDRQDGGPLIGYMARTEVLWAIVAALGICFAMAASNQFVSIEPCGSAFRILSQSCMVQKPIVEIPMGTLLLSSIALIALKIVLTVRSLIRTTR